MLPDTNQSIQPTREPLPDFEPLLVTTNPSKYEELLETADSIYTRLTPEGEVAPSNPGLPPTAEALWEDQRSLITPIYAYWEVKRLLREAQSFEIKSKFD